jgi:hypothetical protein
MIRKRQRGFVLMSALVLAVLYFALMELLLIDSSRALNEAQRFRSRVVAATLAENAAELAALNLVNGGSPSPPVTNDEGRMKGNLDLNGSEFIIRGEGTTSGVAPQTASVIIQGRIDGKKISIDYVEHNP